MQPSDGALDIFNEVDGIEVIQRTPLFARLGFEETHQLAAIMHIERFPRGALILEQDGLGHALYIIRSGEVTVYRHDSSGERDPLGTLGPGELFGEMSLIDDQLISADVEVSSHEAEIVIIPRTDFEQLLETNERLAAKVYRSFCRTLSDRLRKLSGKFVELHAEPDALK